MASILQRLTQRRVPEYSPEGSLRRCLGIFDLVNNGFSVMVGAGIFVITPVLTANTTGPAVIISYLIAGIAALISALTYSELAGKFQGVGSTYLYVYYVLGELAASVIGISMMIESMIGMASVMKSLSIYTDQLLFNGTIIRWETEHLSLNVNYMAGYIDLFGLLLLFLAGVLNLLGVKQTIVFNALCNVIVLVSLILIVVMGFILGDSDNWTLPAPALGDYGSGGFAPYGLGGIFTGASLAYFSYNGFDAVACLGLEAKNPQRDIPVAIVICFGLVMALYMLVCGAITYVAPYYTLGSEAGMALAFSTFPWVAIIVSLGAVLATATGSLSGLLMTSRVIFSMSQDGIIHGFLSKVIATTQVPWVAVVVSMVMPGLAILLLNIEDLVMMNSGGMLICFCLTNICVMVGRYQSAGSAAAGTYTFKEKYSILMALLLWLTSLASCFCFSVIGLTKLGVGSGTFFLCLSLVTLVLLSYLFEEEESPSFSSLSFRCPLVPWLPGLGVYVNSALMVSLPAMTWVRVIVCLAVGLAAYASYGLRNSTVTKARREAGMEMKKVDEEFTLDRDSYSDTDKLVGNEF